MFNDALFQLGMGSVRLDASQKEEPFGLRAIARVQDICVRRHRRSSARAITTDHRHMDARPAILRAPSALALSRT